MIGHAYLHGFSSSPEATKALWLDALYTRHGARLQRPDLRRPSFAELTITAALSALDEMHARTEGTRQSDGALRWRLVGSSFGGYLAARWAELHPDRVDRLLLLAPAFHLPSIMQATLGPSGMQAWRQRGRFGFPDAQGGTTEVNWRFFEDAMAHPSVPQVGCPVRVLHGRADTTVAIASSRAFVCMRPFTLLEECDDGHELVGPSSRELMTAHAYDFMLSDAGKVVEGSQAPEFALPKTRLRSPADASTLACWDFFGPDAGSTAAHYANHLAQFLSSRASSPWRSGLWSEGGGHCAAWAEIDQRDETLVTQTLKAHRLQRGLAGDFGSGPPT